MAGPAAGGLSEAERRAYAANIGKAYAYQLLHALQLWWPIWVIYLQVERGLSLTQITALDAPFFLVQLVSEVPTGAVADRFGRKTSLMIASLLVAAAVFVFGIAENYLVILVSYLLWGVGFTFQSGADSALIYESLKHVGRERDYTKIQGRYGSLESAGMIVGGLLGAPLAAATDLSTPIVLSAGMSLLSFFVALTFKEPASHAHGLSYLETVRGGVGYAFRRKAVRYCVLYAALSQVVGFAPFIFVQPFLVGHGAAIGSLGLFTTPLRVMTMLGMIFAYRAAGGWRWLLFALQPVVFLGAYGGIAGWDSIGAFGLFPLISLFGGLRQPLIIDYVNSRVPGEQRATILSVRPLLFAFVIAAAEPALGVIADEASLRAMFLVAGVASPALLLPVLFLWRRADAEDGEATSSS
jgi:MFS family permease